MAGLEVLSAPLSEASWQSRLRGQGFQTGRRLRLESWSSTSTTRWGEEPGRGSPTASARWGGTAFSQMKDAEREVHRDRLDAGVGRPDPYRAAGDGGGCEASADRQEREGHGAGDERAGLASAGAAGAWSLAWRKQQARSLRERRAVADAGRARQFSDLELVVQPVPASEWLVTPHGDASRQLPGRQDFGRAGGWLG